MGDLIKRFSWAIGATLIGVVLWIGWVTITGAGGIGEETQVAEMPTQLFGGGTRPLTLEVSCSHEGQLYVVFEQYVDWEKGEEPQIVEFDKLLQPGDYTYEVDIPAHTYVAGAIHIEDPPIGARVEVTIRAGGKWLLTSEESLDEPLKDGYAFAAGFEFEDWGGYGF